MHTLFSATNANVVTNQQNGRSSEYLTTILELFKMYKISPYGEIKNADQLWNERAKTQYRCQLRIVHCQIDRVEVRRKVVLNILSSNVVQKIFVQKLLPIKVITSRNCCQKRKHADLKSKQWVENSRNTNQTIDESINVEDCLLNDTLHCIFDGNATKVEKNWRQIDYGINSQMYCQHPMHNCGQNNLKSCNSEFQANKVTWFSAIK